MKIVKSIQAISQSGLHFAKDIFDIQRYDELRELSINLVSEIYDVKNF